MARPSSGGRGGARSGAGRKAGARNKRTQELVKAVAASGQTPLEYLLGVFRSEDVKPELRLDAAKAAAPYVHAKLASIEHKGQVDMKSGVVIVPAKEGGGTRTLKEWNAAVERAVADAPHADES